MSYRPCLLLCALKMATKKLVVAGALGGSGLVGYSVYTTRNLHLNSGTVHMVKISELPVYVAPESRYRYEAVPSETNALTEGLSVVRKFVWKYADATKETREKISHKWEVSKAHTNDLIAQLREDPNLLPKLGFITVSGLTGIILGYRGNRTRKILYSSAGILAASSLCYPNEAVNVTVSAYNKMVDHAKGMWQSQGSSKKKEKSTNKAEEKTAEISESKSVSVDMGQSKEEDKDMYTTRTS